MTDNGSGGRSYEVGRGRPPKSGQIKKGEVRNPFGRNGKPKTSDDVLMKVASELIAANLNGKRREMTQEEAACRRLFQEAINGSATALKVLLEHLARRRPPAESLPTPDELARREADLQQKRELSARLVRLLEEKASRKKALAPRVRYVDGRPIKPGKE